MPPDATLTERELAELDGCGNGRNAIFLARHGFTVEGVDYAEAAIDGARDRIVEALVALCLTRGSVFDRDLAAGGYDLVYGSVWSRDLQVHTLRQMGQRDTDSRLFGENFLWTLLAQKT